MSQELISTEIKGRKVTYYLTSKDDIDSIKSNSVLADVFLCFFSISMGGVLTIWLAKLQTSVDEKTKSGVIVANNILWAISIIFFLLFVFFTFRIWGSVKKLSKSGEIKSFGTAETISKSDTLRITQAIYYTATQTRDVTVALNKLITNNSLSLQVSNDMTGKNDDPDPGIVKKLLIRYTIGGRTFEKLYDEGDMLKIP